MILESIDLASLSPSSLSGVTLPPSLFPPLSKQRQDSPISSPQRERGEIAGGGIGIGMSNSPPDKHACPAKKKPTSRRNRLFLGKCPVSYSYGKTTIFISVLSMSFSSLASVSDTLTTKRREAATISASPFSILSIRWRPLSAALASVGRERKEGGGAVQIQLRSPPPSSTSPGEEEKAKLGSAWNGMGFASERGKNL